MGSYRGRRHAMGLPVRGQNTRSQVRVLLLAVLDKVVRRDSWLMLGLDHDCEKAEQGANKGLGKRGVWRDCMNGLALLASRAYWACRIRSMKRINMSHRIPWGRARGSYGSICIASWSQDSFQVAACIAQIMPAA